MYVRCIDNLNELQRYRDRWNALAGGNVFRCWSWLDSWWRHYGELHATRELRVWLAFRDASGDPAGVRAILPAYAESTWTQGRVLRLLGDGEVCSDHLGLLASTEHGLDGAEAIATQVAAADDWDLIDFSAVDADDSATISFVDALALHDCTASRLLGDRCWAIDLPATWDDFLAMQSKSHRKQLRQLEQRVLDSTRVHWRLVESSDEFGDAWSTLVDLHQRRRQSLGEPGCFTSPTWAAFHWDIALRLLAEGRLRLSCLVADGAPIAAEYHLAGERATFAYQGGVDPQRLAEEPGQLSTICSIQRAIAEGHDRFDLLRGDEPYKAHWRATPRQSLRLVAAPARLWPRLRHGAWAGARNVGRMAQQLTARFS